MPKKQTRKTTKKESINIKNFIPWILVIFLTGTLIGTLFVQQKESAFTSKSKIVRAKGNTYVSVKNLSENFLVELDKDENFAVYEGKTWIPVPGEPIEVLVLNDSECKTCDASTEIMALRQNISPALLIRNVDTRSEEGKKLLGQFEINALPKFFLGAGIEKFKAQDDSLFVDNLKAQNIVIENDGLYLIDSTKVGFKTKKLLSPPEIADIESEPVIGSGKVQVVEFSDFQCPYSKRLHDQNKELLSRLIKENKITYIFKDFPLGFHAESPFAHLAANCVLKNAGAEKWLEMKNKIFETQSEWSGTGEAAQTHMQTLASDLEVDITECMNDETEKTEITNDLAEGQKIGVAGTPALFIGTQIMPGAISPEVFEKAVEEEL